MNSPHTDSDSDLPETPSPQTPPSPQPLPSPPFREVLRVDIAICTWNRQKLLKNTLDSVRRLIVPYQVELRVIVVDNGSTDETARVIRDFETDQKFTKRHRVLALTEPQQGHTNARNTAVDNLDSDLLIWTDDDVLLDAFLVQHYVEFANANSHLAFFGGKIAPDFERTPPDWVTENWDKLSGCFAARDLGDDPIPFTDSRLPYGANFAIRSDVQSAFKFDSTLGRRGDSVHGEDELEMMRRVLAAGFEGSWVPTATVKHFIDSDRLTESYVRNYFLGQGRALVQKGEAWSDNARSLMWRSLRKYMAYRFKRRFANSQTWISLLLESALAEGQSMELKRIDRDSH
jgi:glycosyltransferase involved in cell wall biosynthesis